MGDNDTELHRWSHHDDAGIAPERSIAMHCPTLIASIDAMFNLTGLLLRAAVYSFLWHATSYSDTAVMVLAGSFVGDALASVIHIFWDEAGHRSETAAELVLLLVVFLWFSSSMTWPAIFTASAMQFWIVAGGVTAIRLRRGMLKAVGPNDYGWS
ncbi:MAG: hypothetical protein ACI85K_002426 [Hyphomicrobiaceae bacterium]|jgi:hypothetical protein